MHLEDVSIKGTLCSFPQVLQIFKRISDADAILLGFHPQYARPEWLILQVLPIPPPPVRPSVRFGAEVSEVRVLMNQVQPPLPFWLHGK